MRTTKKQKAERAKAKTDHLIAHAHAEARGAYYDLIEAQSWDKAIDSSDAKLLRAANLLAKAAAILGDYAAEKNIKLDE